MNLQRLVVNGGPYYAIGHLALLPAQEDQWPLRVVCLPQLLYLRS
jgi:hypothetical protein